MCGCGRRARVSRISYVYAEVGKFRDGRGLVQRIELLDEERPVGYRIVIHLRDKGRVAQRHRRIHVPCERLW